MDSGYRMFSGTLYGKIEIVLSICIRKLWTAFNGFELLNLEKEIGIIERIQYVF